MLYRKYSDRIIFKNGNEAFHEKSCLSEFLKATLLKIGAIVSSQKMYVASGSIKLSYMYNQQL